MIGKGNYRRFMQQEIFEQPAVIGDTLQALINPATRTVHLPELPFALGSLKRMTMIACGTVYHACVVAKYWLERIAREADIVLPTLAGPEIGVASTKAFTTQLAVLACFTVALARARSAVDHAREAELVGALT